MLNAAEQQILSTASDEKELAKIRNRLYAPPRGVRKPVATGVHGSAAAVSQSRTAARTGIRADSVADLLSQLKSEDQKWKSG